MSDMPTTKPVERWNPEDRALIFQTELEAAAQALENHEDPQEVATQIRHTLALRPKPAT
jgi:hypothetical protein